MLQICNTPNVEYLIFQHFKLWGTFVSLNIPNINSPTINPQLTRYNQFAVFASISCFWDRDEYERSYESRLSFVEDDNLNFSHSSKVRERAKAVVFKLKSELPRQQFAIAIQAAVSGKILARDDLKALKKDVLAKCYGGELQHYSNAQITYFYPHL